MALTTNLVSYWKLDGNSNDAVGSNNGSDTSITYSNANGIINNGAGFNGSSSTINLGTTSSLNLAGAYSISAWVKLAALAGPLGIVSRRGSNGSPNNSGYLFQMGNTSGKFGVFLNDGTGNDLIQTTGTYSTGVWYHVVLTIDASHNVIIYVNAASAGTGTSTKNVAGQTGTNAYIGQGQDDANTFLMNGDIDEVGIWTRALSSTEVTQLYNSGAGLQYPFAANLPILPVIKLQAVNRSNTY